MHKVLPLPARVSERHLTNIRRLVQYAEVLAEHMNTIDPTGDENGYLWAAIDEGHMTLKQLGGSPHLAVQRRAVG